MFTLQVCQFCPPPSFLQYPHLMEISVVFTALFTPACPVCAALRMRTVQTKMKGGLHIDLLTPSLSTKERAGSQPPSKWECNLNPNSWIYPCVSGDFAMEAQSPHMICMLGTRCWESASEGCSVRPQPPSLRMASLVPGGQGWITLPNVLFLTSLGGAPLEWVALQIHRGGRACYQSLVVRKKTVPYLVRSEYCLTVPTAIALRRSAPMHAHFQCSVHVCGMGSGSALCWFRFTLQEPPQKRNCTRQRGAKYEMNYPSILLAD